MPTKLNREQADTIIQMFDRAKDFEIDAEFHPYEHISDDEIRTTAASDSVSEIKSKLKGDKPELELEEKIEQFYTPLEIAVSTNDKKAFDVLMSLKANPDDLTTPDAVSMLGVAIENYSLVYQEGDKEASKDAVHIVSELIKTSSIEILENPMMPGDSLMFLDGAKPGHTILSELASFDGTLDKSLYTTTIDRLKKELNPEQLEKFVLIGNENGDTFLHLLTSQSLSKDERAFADTVLDALTPEGVERVLTAKNKLGEDVSSSGYISEQEDKDWYKTKIEASRAIRSEKAKAAEADLLAILDEEDAKKNAELEKKNNQKDKKKKKKDKQKQNKQQQSAEAVKEEESQKSSDKAFDSLATENSPEENKNPVVKKEDQQQKTKDPEEAKGSISATESKPETNEQLSQRFVSSVVGDASLTDIVKIQKEINARNDREGFDAFLAGASESGSIREILIDTIETNARFRNDEGKISSRGQKIEFFIDPELKQRIKPKLGSTEASEQQSKSSDTNANVVQSSTETTDRTTDSERVDLSTKSSTETITDRTTSSEQLEAATIPSSERQPAVESRANNPLISDSRAIRELSKYNRQLTREKAELTSQLRQQGRHMNYQQAEINGLRRQVYGLSEENNMLKVQNHNLLVQAQSQAIQINQLLANNQSLEEAQRTFQERYASRGAFNPNALVQQRNESCKSRPLHKSLKGLFNVYCVCF